MGLKNRLAKLLIDPAFRHPGLLKFIFSIDDLTGIDLFALDLPNRIRDGVAVLFVALEDDRC